MKIQSCDPLQKLLTKRGHLKYLYISIHKMYVVTITLIREGRSSVFSSTTYLDHRFVQVHHEILRSGKGTQYFFFRDSLFWVLWTTLHRRKSCFCWNSETWLLVDQDKRRLFCSIGSPTVFFSAEERKLPTSCDGAWRTNHYMKNSTYYGRAWYSSL